MIINKLIIWSICLKLKTIFIRGFERFLFRHFRNFSCNHYFLWEYQFKKERVSTLKAFPDEVLYSSLKYFPNTIPTTT